MDEGEEQRLARAAALAEVAAARLAEAEGRIEELEGRLAALQALCVSLQVRIGAAEADQGAGGASQLGGATTPDYLGEFDDMAADSQISAAHARSLAFRQDLTGCGGVLELHRFQEATRAEGVFRIKTALPDGATQGDPRELVVESPDGDLNDTSGNWLIAARQAGSSSDKTLKWVALTAAGTVPGGGGGYTGERTVVVGSDLSSSAQLLHVELETWKDGALVSVAPGEDIEIPVAECEED